MSPMTNLLRKAWRFNRLITLAGLLHIALIPLLLVVMVVDPKVITGVNGWIKPLKFAISFPIYSFTVTWLLTYVEGRHRLVQIIANITGAVGIIETALITMQVVRGTTSHFNVSTVFDATVFSIMGTAITILAVVNLITVILLSLQKMDDKVFATALRLGLVSSFIGMGVAFLMTSGPTPNQLAALEAGGRPMSIGAHSVGVEDGGTGLPLVGWSTVGGDLRIAHFVGLHGLQVIPLLGYLLTRRRAQRHLSQSQRRAFTWAAGIAYIGWTLLLAWQALRGQSIVTMDGQTALAYLLLVGSTVTALLLTMFNKEQPKEMVVTA